MARSRRRRTIERPARVGPMSSPHGSPSDRGRQLQRTMTAGALGGGALLAGFGFVPALAGAAIGAALGYLFERRAESVHTRHPA